MSDIEDQETLRKFKVSEESVETPKVSPMDPSKLKRSFSTFLVYASQAVDEVKAQTDDDKFGVIAKELAAKFKSLKEESLKEVSQEALKNPLKFASVIDDFVFTEEPKRKKAKKDPNAPKRNMSAYFLYSIAARPKMKEDHPEASFGQIARLLSESFKQLSSKEKEKWDAKALEDKERYEKEMAEYNKDS
eukprot:scaffold406_cov57-Cylindrotheca_fusiformis.AAC.16